MARTLYAWQARDVSKALLVDPDGGERAMRPGYERGLMKC